MSKKHKKNKKAKVKALAVKQLNAKSHFIALEIEHPEPVTVEISNWSKFSKFMGWRD